VIIIFRLATDKDFNNIFNLYKECTRDLNKRGIIQWNENYPTKELIKDNIDKRHQFVYIENDNLVGTFVLSEVEDEYWQKIKWVEDNFLGLHLLAISPEYQNKGHGKKVIDYCEKYAKENNYKVIFYQAEIDSSQTDAFANEIGGKAMQLDPLSPEYLNNLREMAQTFLDVLRD